MLTSNNNPLQELIAVGADALKGLYDIQIDIPTSDISQQQLRVRNAGFKAPDTKLNTYDVKYRGATLTMPKASLDVGQTFDISFRLDANYQVYKALLSLANLTSNPAYGYAASGLPPKENLATVTVYALTTPITDINARENSVEYSSANATALFVYSGCWISRITRPEFKNGTMDAIEITATFNYMTFRDPQSLL